MATLTRSNSRATAPAYKDYVNFLDGYKSGKKVELERNLNTERNFVISSASSSSSSINTRPETENTRKNFALSTSSSSSSTLSSDAPDFSKNTCTSYNSFLENSKNKKFTPVKPHQEKQSMKSEIFIEIQPTKSVSQVSKMFELKEKKMITKSNKINSKISMFEKPDTKPKIAHKPLIPKPPENRSVELIDDLPLPPPPPPEPSVTDEDFPPPPPQLLDSSDTAPTVLPPPPPPPPAPAPTRLQATLTKGPQTTYSVSHTSGPVPTEIDRNNPVMKKLVYGALRGLYGAYHDKANDMMATLPKNMVVRSNGVQDRIEQIASCGGLDKLNGRVNPKQEQE